MVEQFGEQVGTVVAVALDIAAAAIIGMGAIEALLRLGAQLLSRRSTVSSLKAVWLRLAVWILFGLELELGADVVRSALSASWDDVGQLAVIATIRTVLSVVLERDIAREATSSKAHGLESSSSDVLIK